MLHYMAKWDLENVIRSSEMGRLSELSIWVWCNITILRTIEEGWRLSQKQSIRGYGAAFGDGRDHESKNGSNV